ncbi:EamA family transporter [Bdellovibrio bacteriovorus]|uniref:EamA family transporter n=1 Tax=Bdellovibrio bacteriovorus TaxID=959 RepID=UPI0021D1B5A5|nr:EamA family transporter [Bdellovibrio bacteriovorus]UXR65338.1 EamA family transporter [Bdellovibrio bacteriovorus]
MSSLYKSIGLILIAMLSIQFGASVAKGLFPVAGPAGTTALRVFISALILVLVMRPWKENYSSKRMKSLAAYGVSLGAMNLLFYLALERIPLGIAVALEFTGPLAVALLSSKKALDLCWAVLAGVGIYLVLPTSEVSHALDLTGVVLALAAGVFWGLYIIFGKKVGNTEGSSSANAAVGMCFAALVTFPVGLVTNFDQVTSPSLWPMGVAIAILSSALPYSLEMKAMRDMPAKTFGILMSLEPVVATLIGILFLQETLAPIQWAAIVCIVIASAGSTATAK